MRTLPIDIWSDIACPWCYVGKRRLEAALAQFASRDAVHITWHSFQLDPSAPRVQALEPGGYATRLAKKYGTTPQQGQAMIDRMVSTARADGIEMSFDNIRPGNTFDAHRLLHWAHTHKLQDALKERLFRAYLCEGQAIGEPDVLVRLAGDVGLDVDEAQGIVSGDAFATAVRADLTHARTLGITGVPFFVVGQHYGVSGAQSAETLLAVLQRWWDESAGDATQVEGAVCGPEGCEPA